MSDAQGQDQFQPVANRRAGYTDALGWALKIAAKGGTLAAGEGRLILDHYEDRLARCQCGAQDRGAMGAPGQTSTET